MLTRLYLGSFVRADSIVLSISCFHWSKSDKVACDNLGIWHMAFIVLCTSPMALTGSQVSKASVSASSGTFVASLFSSVSPRVVFPDPGLARLRAMPSMFADSVRMTLWTPLNSSLNEICIWLTATSMFPVRCSWVRDGAAGVGGGDRVPTGGWVPSAIPAKYLLTQSSVCSLDSSPVGSRLVPECSSASLSVSSQPGYEL